MKTASKKLDKKSVIALYNAIRDEKADWPNSWEVCDTIQSYVNNYTLVKFKNNKNEKWKLGGKYKSIHMTIDSTTKKTKVEISNQQFNTVDMDLGWGHKTIGKPKVKKFKSMEDALTFIYNFMLVN